MLVGTFRTWPYLGDNCLVIRLENVALSYGYGVEVLRNVSFHLRPGSFHFLTGPSGAGKTTLLRLMFLSLEPTGGRIEVFNQGIHNISPSQRARLRRRIGIVFQDFRLLDHLTTWQNVNSKEKEHNMCVKNQSLL